MKTITFEPFRIFAADYSLRRPGFAIMTYNPASNKVTVEALTDIDNRVWGMPYGYLLKRIYDTTYRLTKQADVFVREGAWYSGNASGHAMFKVLGVADTALWASREASFYDISPSKVKQLVTGDANASKVKVAAYVGKYVGRLSVTCLDQTDAVAVGLAWLMEAGFMPTFAHVRPKPIRGDARRLGLPTQNYYNYPHLEALQHAGK